MIKIHDLNKLKSKRDSHRAQYIPHTIRKCKKYAPWCDEKYQFLVDETKIRLKGVAINPAKNRMQFSHKSFLRVCTQNQRIRQHDPDDRVHYSKLLNQNQLNSIEKRLLKMLGYVHKIVGYEYC